MRLLLSCVLLFLSCSALFAADEYEPVWSTEVDYVAQVQGSNYYFASAFYTPENLNGQYSLGLFVGGKEYRKFYHLSDDQNVMFVDFTIPLRDLNSTSPIGISIKDAQYFERFIASGDMNSNGSIVLSEFSFYSENQNSVTSQAGINSVNNYFSSNEYYYNRGSKYYTESVIPSISSVNQYVPRNISVQNPEAQVEQSIVIPTVIPSPPIPTPTIQEVLEVEVIITELIPSSESITIPTNSSYYDTYIKGKKSSSIGDSGSYDSWRAGK